MGSGSGGSREGGRSGDDNDVRKDYKRKGNTKKENDKVRAGTAKGKVKCDC